MTLRRLLPGSLLLLFVPGPGFAQTIGTGTNTYEQLYGTPVDVTLTDLAQNPVSYEGRAVRTKGRLDVAGSRGTYLLRDMFRAAVVIAPVPDVATQFEHEAFGMVGRDVEVTGVFRVSSAADGSTGFAEGAVVGTIAFWEYLGPPEGGPKAPVKASNLTLEALVRRPGAHDGETVRVVGKFRGRNLYGDLPARSERASGDWVIKDDLFAVWVTGKKPRGRGWELDAGLKRDTGRWIEVVGRVDTRDGIIYIRALEVSLTSPPTPTADAQPPPPPPPPPKVPPVVVFTLPLDGEGDLPRDSRFVVQFSKDMDERTFSGHVLLRYVGAPRPGDRGFDAIKLTYDGGRRALTVDPGDILRSGRRIELLLLPGIADVDGLGLVPRPGKQFQGAVDVLRYQVGL